MIIGGIVALTLIIMGIVWKIKDGEGLGAIPGGIAFGLLIMLLLGIIFIVPAEDCIYETNTENILSMQDNTMTTGRYSILVGSVDSDIYYCYAKLNTDGSYTVKKIKSDKVKVYELDIDEPYIEHISACGFKNWYNYILSTPIFYEQTKIYVPVGTLKQVYKIDLQ